MRVRWLFISGFLSLFILSVWFSQIVYDFYLPDERRMSHSDYVCIKKNTTLNQVCRILYQKGIIKHPKLLSLWLRVIGKDKVQAGVYQFVARQAVMSFIEDLNQGHVIQLPFIVIAGHTWPMIKARLSDMPWLQLDTDSSKVLAVEQNHSMAGLLLADTYYYSAESKASSLVIRANSHLNDVLQSNWQSRSYDLPFQTPYELLIAASIIEKETAVEAERGLIAQVIVNRLKKHMRLQMDPTVIYALGDAYDGSLTKKDLRIDSPYNTYRYHGLPPTPIAMVEKASIEAAAHPTPGNYLYFVAKGDGHHFFSDNYKQHLQAVMLYNQGPKND